MEAVAPSLGRSVMVLVRTSVILLSAVSLTCGAGCVSRKTPATPLSSMTLAFADESPDAERLWSAIQDTLRSHHYELDRVDRRFGVITTLPAGSQQLFEFWRHDVATGRDLLESSLSPTRRRVEVTMNAGEDGGALRVEVSVLKQRLSSLDRQFNNSGAAYQVFGEKLPATTGQPRVSHKDEQWLDLGRDAAMEDYLLRGILSRAGLSNASNNTVPASS